MSRKTIDKVVKLFGWLDGAFVKCSSIIVLLLVVAWIAWPSQINFKARFDAGPAKGVILDPIHRDEFTSKFYALTNPMQERALKLGAKYTPKDYYADIREIDLWISKQRIYDSELVNSVKGSLRGLMIDYTIYQWRNDKREEMNRAALEYEDWHDKVFPQEKRKVYTNAEIATWLISALRWFLVFWLRSIPLIAVLYLLRMAGRTGILNSLLQDRGKFILAVVFWPIYFWRYPHWVYREIVAEAELRRIKNPFRRLNSNERETVRNVTGDKRQFNDWRADFRLVHEGSFKRSFATALLVTIVMMLLAPVARSFPVGAENFLPVQMDCIHAPPPSEGGVNTVSSVRLVQPNQSDQQDFSNAGIAILANEFLLVIPRALQFIIHEMHERLITGFIRDLIPIPKISPVTVF